MGTYFLQPGHICTVTTYYRTYNTSYHNLTKRAHWWCVIHVRLAQMGMIGGSSAVYYKVRRAVQIVQDIVAYASCTRTLCNCVCKPVFPHSGNFLFAMLVLGGCSFTKVLDLSRKLRQTGEWVDGLPSFMR